MAKAATRIGKSQWILSGVIASLLVAAALLGRGALERSEKQEYREEATRVMGRAIFAGSIPDAKAALDAGADPNGHFGGPYSLTTQAKLRARIFLKPNSDQAASARRHLSDRGDSALSIAVTMGDPEMVSLL